MKGMGFLGNVGRDGKADGTPDDRRCMLRFDSGRGVSFADATHHVLVTGSTGSGKTASVILPSLARLFAEGHGGLLIDIKGNLRGNARKLAAEYGREADLVEVGCGPEAMALNLLEGKSRFEMYDFFEDIMLQSFQGQSHNLDFHVKGVSIAVDCGQVLAYLRALDPRFIPCVSTIADMINDYQSSRLLFRLFMEKVFDPANEEHARFVSNVTNNRFNVLKERKDEQRGGASATTEEQMTFNLHAIRTALKTFMDAPGVAAHFSSPGAPGLDMRPLLRDGRIILLRFDPNTGPIGTRLARALVNSFYAAVCETGLARPADKYYFICIDEFQEVADLSANRYSDVNFIAQAREFGCIFLASTQSMAALINRGASLAAVEAFVANCNQRIMLYSDDPLTQEMARRYDGGMFLNNLDAGHAFVVRYDQTLRQHVQSLETLDTGYLNACAVLDRQPEMERGESMPPPAPAGSLYELAGIARKLLGEEAEKKSPPRIFPTTSHDAATAAKPAPPFAEDSRPRRSRQPVDKSRRPADAGPVLERVNAPGAILLANYPDYFDEDVEIAIPAGWLGYVGHAFDAFSRLGLPVKISRIRISDGVLRAYDASSGYRHSNGAISALNSLLEPTCGLCMLCGSPTGRQSTPKACISFADDSEDDAPEGSPHPLCSKCQKNLGLVPGDGFDSQE